MNLFTQHHVCHFGTQTVEREETLGLLNRAAVEISWVVSGELTVYSDGHPTTATAGSATFIFCNRTLEFRNCKNSHTVWCHIKCDGISEPDQAWYSAIATPCRPSPLLKLLLKHGLALGEVNEDSPERQLRDSLGLATFNEYFRIAHANNADKQLPASLYRAKNYMERNYAKPCELDRVAAAAHLAPRYLIELFKRHLGTTPIRYLWKCRAEAGIHLLRTTDMSIEKIAHRAGFQSASHFSRYLKLHHLHAPTDLRKRFLRRE